MPASDRQTRDFDRELERRIALSLIKKNIPSLRRIHVSVHEARASLRGTVGSYFERQTALDAARSEKGIANVLDHIAVIKNRTGVQFSFSPELQRYFERRRKAAGETPGDELTPEGQYQWLLERGWLPEAAVPRERRGLHIAAAAAAVLLVTGTIVWASSSKAPELPPTFPVRGRLLIGGWPAAGATLVFHPQGVDRSAPRPTAKADAEGRYSLSTFKPGDGAPVGNYLVTVELRQMVRRGEDFELGPNQAGAKYGRVTSTTLAAKIGEATAANKFDFSIERDGAPPPVARSASRPAYD